MAMVILAIDYIVYCLLFFIGAYSVTITGLYVTGGAERITELPRWGDTIMRLLFIPPVSDDFFLSLSSFGQVLSPRCGCGFTSLLCF